MMEDCLRFLKKHKIKLVYAHNAERFDNLIIAQLVLLLGKMGKAVTVNMNKVGNKIGPLVVTHGAYTFKVKDSLLLLPGSLNDLCTAYGYKNKHKFPHAFVGESTICYEGPKPDKKYYQEISDVEYAKLPAKISIKSDCIDYMMWDCEVLHLILDKFRKDIYEKYKIDALKSKTISGLAYRI